MKLAKDYIEKIEKQLGELGIKIDDLSLKLKSEAKSKYDETANSLRTHIEESLEKAGRDIELQFKEWEITIDELKGKGKEEAKKEFEEIKNNIRTKIEELSTALKDMKKSGGEALDELRTGAKGALNVLKDSLIKAKEKIK